MEGPPGATRAARLGESCWGEGISQWIANAQGCLPLKRHPSVACTSPTRLRATSGQRGVLPTAPRRVLWQATQREGV